MRFAALVLLATGCDAVFLGDPPPADQRCNPNENVDEDKDGTVDSCDFCPHLSSAKDSSVDADPDGDFVGNACDPNPDVAGERITFFDGFSTVGGGGYAEFLGTRVANEGHAELAANDRLMIGGATNQYRFEVGFYVTNASVPIGYMALVHSAQPESSGPRYAGYACYAGRNTTDTDFFEIRLITVDGASPALNRKSADLDGFDQLVGRYSMEVSATTVRCAVTYADGFPLDAFSHARQLESTNVGVFINEATVQLEYALLITSP